MTLVESRARPRERAGQVEGSGQSEEKCCLRFSPGPGTTTEGNRARSLDV